MPPVPVKIPPQNAKEQIENQPQKIAYVKKVISKIPILSIVFLVNTPAKPVTLNHAKVNK